jgi:hypothetical protein
MATYTKFQVTTKDLVNGAHNFGSNTFKAMLTNTAPTSANAVKADITDITAATGYAAGGPAVTMAVSTASGVAKVTATNVTITAGATVGPFRYVVIYNDTQASPAKPLVCFFDYGSAVTLNSGDTFTISFDGTNGLFTIA